MPTNAQVVSYYMNRDRFLNEAAVNLIFYRGLNKDRAANILLDLYPEFTPNGVKYSKTTIRNALKEKNFRILQNGN